MSTTKISLSAQQHFYKNIIFKKATLNKRLSEDKRDFGQNKHGVLQLEK
jgi:hypothetical protein